MSADVPKKTGGGFAASLAAMSAKGLSGFGADSADSFSAVVGAVDGHSGKVSVQAIEVGLIDPSPDQTRPIDWDWVQTLALSIAEVGLNQPIKLRPNPEQAGRYLVITGEHRWRAHIHAKIGAVDAIIDREATASTSAVETLIENLLRKDLNPLQTAQGLRKLIDKHGYSYAQLGKSLGKGKTWVANHIGMLALPEPVLEAVERGALRDYTVIANIGKVFKEKTAQVAAALADASAESPFTRADLQRLDAPSTPASDASSVPASSTDVSPPPSEASRTDSPETDPASAKDGAGMGVAPEAGKSVAPVSQKSPAPKRPVAARVVVTLADGNELGTLLLDAEADEGMAMVRLANGGSSPYPLADLRILRLTR
ncbi:Nucleoid occlusion protein (plasmid) [Xanthomonas hydrangeae]|uniref:ParB/RepB/Spo0J family partition protein n=1 Tax=Xanthomonas hydrangeae TaxID=2775159 RepID=UPI0019661027|nr:Nucleoid occlusion protein [Xanthomonas hydrangeae]CAD7740896.1 Nucleoid occlusion protein [Xanthomonas hydrangeae]CAD7747852.1 Nucleoid occlusion protein [Xanthomonas hydrangeae]CAD7747853.1 Nucleoid occlusion protein [Xanthomonas hydrangeae]CAD7748270.1 Nucleoid occlusion protein [Xanthomonas hydrangeae]